jgi:hypothetical protein
MRLEKWSEEQVISNWRTPSMTMFREYHNSYWYSLNTRCSLKMRRTCTLESLAMARPKLLHSRSRHPPLVVRLLPQERRFIEAAKEAELRKLAEVGLKGVSLTPSGFVRAGAIERGERILGMTLEQFEDRELGASDQKRKKRSEKVGG